MMGLVKTPRNQWHLILPQMLCCASVLRQKAGRFLRILMLHTTTAHRAVHSYLTTDFMTAHYAHLPHDLLAKISNRIINEVHGISRVVYDISSKPPATIEWE